ncbi:MAG: hypothetical protein AB9888_15495 [Bacteroidales bacterium]
MEGIKKAAELSAASDNALRQVKDYWKELEIIWNDLVSPISPFADVIEKALRAHWAGAIPLHEPIQSNIPGEAVSKSGYCWD